MQWYPTTWRHLPWFSSVFIRQTASICLSQTIVAADCFKHIHPHSSIFVFEMPCLHFNIWIAAAVCRNWWAIPHTFSITLSWGLIIYPVVLVLRLWRFHSMQEFLQTLLSLMRLKFIKAFPFSFWHFDDHLSKNLWICNLNLFFCVHIVVAVKINYLSARRCVFKRL